MKKMFLALALLACSSLAFAYTAADRFKLMEDKYKTFDFLNDDPDHLHIVDLNLGANFDILNLVSEIPNATDDASALALLTKWEGTEHFLRLKLGVTIPLFKFEAWGVKVRPSINLEASGGLLMGIDEEPLTIAMLSQFVGGLPPALMACIEKVTQTNLDNNGDDIVKAADEACGNPPGTYGAFYGMFEAPDTWGTAPVLSVMSKGDLKGGINFKMNKGGFFGHFGLNALFRSDFSALINAESFGAGTGVMSLLTDLSLHGFLMGDLMAGYRYKMLSIQGGIEELKIAQAVDKSDKSGELVYGTPLILRLHGQANLSFASFSLRPFAGFSTRSGYTITQGMYAGADFGIHFMKKRFGMGLRAMFDQHHITLGVQPRLGIVQLDAMGKIPIAAEVDGVAPPTIVSVGLSIFI